MTGPYKLSMQINGESNASPQPQ